MAQGDKVLYLVCEPGVKPNTELLDPKFNAHVIKATSPKAAAVIYGIKSWALFHCGEELYDVYDKKGELLEQCTLPPWIDLEFGECIKSAFHVEVLVERNDIGRGQTNPDEVQAAVDALNGGGMAGAMAALQGGQGVVAPVPPPDEEEEEEDEDNKA